MKNECSIVRDLLPLYAEGMLSEDSAAFVKEHLDTCEECCALSAGEEPSAPTDADTEQRTGEAGVLRTLKKKLRKQTLVCHRHYSGRGAAGYTPAAAEPHRLSGRHQRH